MKCFVVSRDLMFSSQVGGAAKAAGCQCHNVPTAAQVETEESDVVILDLTTADLDVTTVVAGLKENASTTIVAVGPHVHEARLRAAQQAGCDYVLTKGQASRELGQLLMQLAADTSN